MPKELITSVSTVESINQFGYKKPEKRIVAQQTESYVVVSNKKCACQEEKNISLHWAAMGDCAKFVRFLREKELLKPGDKKVDQTNSIGDSPLHIACRQQKWNVASELLALDADCDLDNVADPIPETPYALAVKYAAPPTLMQKLNEARKRRTLTKPRSNVVLEDISRGLEGFPIPVINDMQDGEKIPNTFHYITSVYESGDQFINRRIDSMEDGLLTAENFDEMHAEDLIKECSQICKCNARCSQRVAQKGMSYRMEIFRTARCGWGLRAVEKIPRGAYVCEYAGEVLAEEVADAREVDTYLFEILIEGHNHCIDANLFGNVSRFINHSCDPNLHPKKVLWDHSDHRYPHVGFYALKDIVKGEQLTFNYGKKWWDVKSAEFSCQCNSSKCDWTADQIREKGLNRANNDDQLIGHASSTSVDNSADYGDESDRGSAYGLCDTLDDSME